MKTLLKSFLRNESGATAIEYAIVAAGISVLIVGGAQLMGSRVSNLYINKVAGNLT